MTKEKKFNKTKQINIYQNNHLVEELKNVPLLPKRIVLFALSQTIFSFCNFFKWIAVWKIFLFQKANKQILNLINFVKK